MCNRSKIFFNGFNFLWMTLTLSLELWCEICCKRISIDGNFDVPSVLNMCLINLGVTLAAKPTTIDENLGKHLRKHVPDPLEAKSISTASNVMTTTTQV